MGRPLNKKYFGNRNVGSSSTTADNKIGGEGIASITWSNRGSWLSATSGSAPLAGLALPAPTLPGGVQATWTNYFGAHVVTTGAGSVGLVQGETYEYAPIPGLLVTVLTSSNNGTNATFEVTTAGSTTSLLQDLTGVNLTKSAGMSGVGTFLVDIKLKIVDTIIGEAGSGYTGAETFTVTLVNGASGTAPAGTLVLTTDSGSAGSSTNQENAIVAYAYLVGSELKVGDIVKQTNDRRYKVKTADGTGICQLATELAVDEGFMNIVATDSAGGTYFVKKLLSRKAVLVPAAVARLSSSAGSQFASGTSAKWTFGSAVLNTTVTIENA